MIESEFHNSKIFQDHLFKIKTPLQISRAKNLKSQGVWQM